MNKRTVGLFSLSLVILLLIGCQIIQQSGGDMGGPTSGESLGFTEAEQQTIISYAQSDFATLNLPVSAPSVSFYRFDAKNEKGARRLATIVSYAEALATPTYGPESTARVFLYDSLKKKAGYDFDYFAFVKDLPTAAVQGVTSAMVPYFLDPDFLLNSTSHLDEMPTVAGAIQQAVAGLTAPASTTFAAAPIATGAIVFDLKPRFSNLGQEGLYRVIFHADMLALMGKIQNTGFAKSPLVACNVPLSAPASVSARISAFFGLCACPSTAAVGNPSAKPSQAPTPPVGQPSAAPSAAPAFPTPSAAPSSPPPSPMPSAMPSAAPSAMPSAMPSASPTPPKPPTLTPFTSPIATTNEDTAVEVAFTPLVIGSNASDSGSTITGFVIKSVATGSLMIGPSKATASNWQAGTNDFIDSSKNAYWTPPKDGNGTLEACSVTARNGLGLESTAISVSVTVTPVNDVPVITSYAGVTAASVSVPEHTAGAVATVTATDVDAGQTLSYSIVGGADQSKFSITSDKGVLSILAAPDFENPSDSDQNNVYVVNVQVSDGNGGTSSQTVNVTVQDVAEPKIRTVAVIDAMADGTYGDHADDALRIYFDRDMKTTNVSSLDPDSLLAFTGGQTDTNAQFPTTATKTWVTPRILEIRHNSATALGQTIVAGGGRSVNFGATGNFQSADGLPVQGTETGASLVIASSPVVLALEMNGTANSIFGDNTGDKFRIKFNKAMNTSVIPTASDLEQLLTFVNGVYNAEDHNNNFNAPTVSISWTDSKTLQVVITSGVCSANLNPIFGMTGKFGTSTGVVNQPVDNELGIPWRSFGVIPVVNAQF